MSSATSRTKPRIRARRSSRAPQKRQRSRAAFGLTQLQPLAQPLPRACRPADASLARTQFRTPKRARPPPPDLGCDVRGPEVFRRCKPAGVLTIADLDLQRGVI